MENTLEAALKQWKEREQRYEKLFSPSVLKSREFLKEKLKHYDGLRAKIIAGSIKQDPLAMRALLLERKQLARQAYPNLIIRLVNDIISKFKLDKDVVKVRQQAESNAEAVLSNMAKAGLEKHYGLVEQQMKQGLNEFTVPVSYQVNEHERMDLQLNFKKDNDGRYLFENYKATLSNELEKGKPKQHAFSNESQTINTDKAYNLLSGRAIFNGNSSSWQQLDFNDKDANGNFRMKHFPDSYGFDLNKELAQLPLKPDEKEMFESQMKEGVKVEAKLTIDSKEHTCSLISNPQKKEIGIYNNEGQKLTIDQLKENTGSRKNQSNIRQLLPQKQDEKQKGKSVRL